MTTSRQWRRWLPPASHSFASPGLRRSLARRRYSGPSSTCTTDRPALSGVYDAGMDFRTGLTRPKRRRLRPSGAHAEPAFREYYYEHRPATAKTFRESVNAFRRMRLEVDDVWESLGRLAAMTGHLESPRSEEKRGRWETWIATAERYRMRHPFVAWRASVLKGRHERRDLGRCFAAWAWHPEGALIGSLARSHGDAFGRGDL